MPIPLQPTIIKEYGALKVSTGWRKLLCDAGRERVSSRKSKTQKKVNANNIVPFARKAVAVA